MTQPGEELVYATLLLSDSYLPGALVLAHSLRDAGTAHKLAILVTLDTVSADAITQLQTVYDHVLPVPRIRNEQPANLYLMNRADLHSAFTKINLWKQTQFSKIVYIDADVVAYRAPDELFRTPHAFSAAPDIGWPDLFNSGVMVLTPNMGDYYAMMAMAERGISFDGADQGLLNMHFKNSYNRLSFTYNVTPSAHYQYIPAYRHFQSSINMVHFIGSNKPWFEGRNAPHGNSPYDEMVGRWWAVYDRHYRAQEQLASNPNPQFVQYFTKGELQPISAATHSGPLSEHSQGSHQHSGYTTGEYQPQPPAPQHPSSASSSASIFASASASSSSGHEQPGHSEAHDSQAGDSATHPPGHQSGTTTETRPDQQFTGPTTEPWHEPPPIAMHSWDAQRQPPPADSQPEAMNFPSTHYEMSQDTTPFKPPARYPSPPRNMWYEIPPKEAPSPSANKPRTIFPWEEHQPRASRSFAAEDGESPPPAEPSTGEASGDSAAEDKPVTPTTPTINIIPSDPWNSYMRSNAWDEVPEINRYVDGLQKHRRGTSLGSVKVGSPGAPGAGPADPADPEAATRKSKPHGFKLTDFPTELERPSLPVTPAPMRRPSFWGEEEQEAGDDGRQSLPTAEGVPGQTEWVCVHGKRWSPADCPCKHNVLADDPDVIKDPAVQLQKLAKQQSDVLLRKLGGDEEDGEGGVEGGVSREIPSRSMPFGSESESMGSSTYAIQSETNVLSPRPMKGETATVGLVKRMSGEAETGATMDLTDTADAAEEPVSGTTAVGDVVRDDEVVSETV